jgi:HEPN domain-containing protein
MKKSTANWLATADYDLQTAEAMLKSKRYLYVVFMCHLAIEKTLKAMFAEAKSEAPPRTHDLLLLVRRIGLTLPKTHLDFVAAISNASIPTRYPEDLSQLVRQYPARIAGSYLSKTKRLHKWLRKDPSLTQS